MAENQAGGMDLECVEIRGGKPLYGTVEIQGSKNAVLPMLAGCVLHAGVSRMEHCPRIRDVEDSILLLEALGCSVWWEGSCLAVDAARISTWKIPEEIGSRMRSSILFLGALLGRMGKAGLPYPGGCVLGARPIDLHLAGLRQLGARIEEDASGILAHGEGLKGAKITLRFPSVGATENIILAAVLADGETEIRNAAREPEIGELCRFLQEKGADIRIFPEGRICIRGKTGLQDSRHELEADRIVAGTYLMAGAVTGGRITLERMPHSHMEAVYKAMKETGILLEREGERLTVDGSGGYHGIPLLETAPYPGFPTDLQSPMMTLLSVAGGNSRIRENIFESRFKTAAQLQKMGADIRLSGRDAFIRGTAKLHGACVEAFELRGAAALVLAGLQAEGVTRISGCRFIDRGYERIFEDLEKLGADIRNAEHLAEQRVREQ